jgi:hypothetical protein
MERPIETAVAPGCCLSMVTMIRARREVYGPEETGSEPVGVVRATMKADRHKREFEARFRRHAFGWKSPPAIRCVKQTVSEISAS